MQLLEDGLRNFRMNSGGGVPIVVGDSLECCVHPTSVSNGRFDKEPYRVESRETS